MRRVLVLVCLLLSLPSVMAGPALAQVPPHDHWLTVPGTGDTVQVGPRRCDLRETVQRGFLKFHFDVHLGEPTSTGGLTITATFCP